LIFLSLELGIWLDGRNDDGDGDGDDDRDGDDGLFLR
jgi:hypothetical protein